ncbi:hypothetical protein B0T26DRAFT_762134 [Lasiosphaeria miniovina]|uniref:Peptidase A1 domain-containing protein n=1 Tax=Lasiosphaeria miniovina TaxID=1954250 RepID=A0AA40EDT4_9PEZI|nr:uncharacterized protein B0T26DRAFT_762134 [Lasiosphaeria miniovina]KAK0734677.1 hypothetical protein B0T26DRAFT_762134 [Lasiosphaeria miniovina]
MMFLPKHVLAMLPQLATLAWSQDFPGNPFDAAETVIATSTSTCYALPIQTTTATKATYNGTVDSDSVGGLSYFLDEFGQVLPVFGLRDVQSQTDLLFDISDPVQLGIVYPDNSAVVFNGSGITVISADCSSVLSLVLPGFYDYLIQQGGGGGGGTRKSKKRSPFLHHAHHQGKLERRVASGYPIDYFVDVVVFDQCGNTPSDPFDVTLTIGGGFECRDRADIINGVWMQGVNGLYKWTCMWPSPASREQMCELELLRQLGYSRDDFGTLVPAPSLVSILSTGIDNLPPLSGAAAEILNSPYFSPTWSSTMTGLKDLMYLQQLIDAQQLDPNAIAASVCLSTTDLKEFVWLKIRDPPGYQYLLTSVIDDTIRFTSSMQFNQEIIGTATASCLFSGPSTLPLTTPVNTNILIGCNDPPAQPTATAGPNPLPGGPPGPPDPASSAAAAGGPPARVRPRTDPAVCTATNQPGTATSTSSTTSSPSSSSTSWKISIETFSNPPLATTTCSFDQRCDPAPSSKCEGPNTALTFESPDWPGCQCGHNVEGRVACFRALNPVRDPSPTPCASPGDCPGGMLCIHDFPCWFVGPGIGGPTMPGECYNPCPWGGV